MAYTIATTTAEHVVGAVDACSQFPDGADAASVATFLDVTEDAARHALVMGEQLGFCKNTGTKYVRCGPIAQYLITPNAEQKAAILGLAVEDYPPFRVFRERLRVTGLAPKAAEQVKAVFQIGAHREDIQGTLTSIGTYCKFLQYQGAGLYGIDSLGTDWPTVARAIADQAAATELVIKRVGSDVVNDADPVIITELAIGVRELANDARSAIVHAANAVESVLVALATKHSVNVQGATGINSKAERLLNQHHLDKKLHGVALYLGHVRNASDHGIDPAINAMWGISGECAAEYVGVATTFVSSVLHVEHGTYSL